MTLKNMKIILKILIAAAAALLLAYTFVPEAQRADLATISRGDVVISLEGEGKTRIHNIYVVSAPIEGRVTRIEREPGDDVIAGETVVANMHPADPRFLDSRSETQAKADVQGAEAALGLARAKLNRAEAALDFAQSDFRRTEELYKKGTVSIARLERDELSLRMTRAEVNTEKSNLKVAESLLEAARARLQQPGQSSHNATDAELCQVCVHAPVSGKVLRILHKSEGVIAVGTPLAEVGDLQDLEVVIEMLSRDAVKVEVGHPALIKRWGGTENIRARVRVVEPSGYTKISALGVEEQRVNIILDFIDPIEKWQSLGDAFRVEAGIIVDAAKDVLYVPLSALFRDGEKWSVFVVEEGRARLRNLEVGRKNDYRAEILSGLEAGERVIIHPASTIVEGSKVEE